MLKLMRSYKPLSHPLTLLCVNLNILKIKINNNYVLYLSHSWIYQYLKTQQMENIGINKIKHLGIPGWRSGLAPAFGPGRNPGDPGSSPTSGSRCMEPASPSAYVSASLSLSVTIIIKLKKFNK